MRTVRSAVAWLLTATSISLVAHAAVIVSNAAGVVVSITGIVYYPTDNSIGVQFYVTAPTTTNISTFTVQKSLDLKTWTNYSSSMTITGSWPQSEIGDSVTAPSQFYRIQLSNEP